MLNRKTSAYTFQLLFQIKRVAYPFFNINPKLLLLLFIFFYKNTIT